MGGQNSMRKKNPYKEEKTMRYILIVLTMIQGIALAGDRPLPLLFLCVSDLRASQGNFSTLQLRRDQNGKFNVTLTQNLFGAPAYEEITLLTGLECEFRDFGMQD